jgi:NADH dehydrogenase (ubiquinone) 1 beta subcomplex subunit 7
MGGIYVVHISHQQRYVAPADTRPTMSGGHHVTKGSEPKKEQDLQAIKDARIPLAWRDTCSHLLIHLNGCRRETWWNPNKCESERHIYEECEYNAYLQRVEAKVQMDKL